MEYVVVNSDDSGDLPSSWPEPIGLPSAALMFAAKKLVAADMGRCGRRGRLKLVLARTDMGLWVATVFQADDPSGGACSLLGPDLRESISEPVRFEWDEIEDPSANELHDALLNDELVFDAVFYEMTGRHPPSTI